MHLPMDEIVSGKLVGDIAETVMSSCSVPPGIVGSSVYFDGVSAWIDLGNHRDRYVLRVHLIICRNKIR